MLFLIVLTILSGGFVAGLNAGLVYNTFPLMDGDLVPAGYSQLDPWILNWFENLSAVQFNHRLLAVLTVLAALSLSVYARLWPLNPRSARAFGLLAAAAVLQGALGIATLLLVVPVPLAAAHQAGAILLLTAALWTLRQLPVRSITQI